MALLIGNKPEPGVQGEFPPLGAGRRTPVGNEFLSECALGD